MDQERTWTESGSGLELDNKSKFQWLIREALTKTKKLNHFNYGGGVVKSDQKANMRGEVCLFQKFRFCGNGERCRRVHLKVVCSKRECDT